MPLDLTTLTDTDLHALLGDAYAETHRRATLTAATRRHARAPTHARH